MVGDSVCGVGSGWLGWVCSCVCLWPGMVWVWFVRFVCLVMVVVVVC